MTKLEYALSHGYDDAKKLVNVFCPFLFGLPVIPNCEEIDDYTCEQCWNEELEEVNG